MAKEDDNKNVIIIQEENNNKKENGFTLAKYGHYISLYRYWIVAITLIVAIIGYLFAFIYYNPKAKVLTSTFTLDIPVKEAEKDTSSDKKLVYYDGTLFNYNDILSVQNLKHVIDNTKVNSESDEKKYANIFVDKLSEMGTAALKIEPVYNDNKEAIPMTYKITAKVKYIGGKDSIAKSFIEDVVKYSTEIAYQKSENYKIDSYLTSDLLSKNYLIISKFFKDEYDTIDNAYANLIKSYSASATTSDMTETLSQRKNRFEQQFIDLKSVSLSSEANNKVFYNVSIPEDDASIDALVSELKKKTASLEDEKTTLTDKKNKYQSYVDSLPGQLQNLPSYAEDWYKQLDIINTNLESVNKEIELIGYNKDTASAVPGKLIDILNNEVKNKTEKGLLWKKENAEFKNRIQNIYNSLYDYENKANSDIHYACKNLSKGYVFNEVGNGTVTGGINEWIVTIAFLILGFILSSIIFYGIGVHRDNKLLITESSKKTSETLPKLLNDENQPDDVVIPSDNQEDVY